MSEYVLEVTDIKKHFKVGPKKTVKSVDGISFGIKKGETLGLVGESGSGKSTLGRTVVGLYEATTGNVSFEGKKLSELDSKGKKEFNRQVQMIFQDPHSSLNPRMKVGDIVAEGIDAYKLLKGKEKKARVIELLEQVGLNREHADRYPHEFSGGQRQRIGIARALAVKPSFIVADEAISALDVSVQAQVINLLQDLQKKEQLTYLFIAHDLAMVKHISDRIGVIYLGKMMELAESTTLFKEPLHPYTKALLSAIPVSEPRLRGTKERIVLSGDPPSPLNPPSGCPFRTRCPMAMDICTYKTPEWKEVSINHWVSCHLF
ncbi:ABC transporter ATP-binding protein [Gottfriedia sp. NPDC058432]|uniref:ABC transporter ATP-binding protein n=1 Tax=Gottfriedia sp. NPDC058432 TaxID=3346497 RepID=UPI00365DFD7B